MNLKAIFLNCTLKKSPETSNTEALIQKAKKLFSDLGVESRIVRLIDHDIAFGVTSDEGKGDEWPKILDEIKASDILILCTPIWLGDKSSICKMAIERIDGSTSEQEPEKGQYPLYNKVGGVLITGNEDGAKRVSADVLFSLNHSGCTIPPNSGAYWVGKAGPGPSYIEGEGDKHLFTNKNLRLMVYNLVNVAKVLKQNPIATNIFTLTEEAKRESKA
jgi:multimeric flavodoxin WrbA